MKKLLLSILCLCSLVAKADEGMWTLYNLPDAVYNQMKQYGFQLSKDQLYQSDNAVKNAVVNFGGFCSGVVVSPDGLVFTNHHCGFDAIRKHSTVEHDYMLNGFYAKSFEEELPNEDLFVSFMIEQKDVTDQIAPALKGIKRNKQGAIVDSIENAWQKDILRCAWKSSLSMRATSTTAPPTATSTMCAWCSPFQSLWVSLVARRTTGCGPARRVTIPCSVSMPTPRPTAQQSTPRTTFPIIPSRGLLYPCKATSLAISV